MNKVCTKCGDEKSIGSFNKVSRNSLKTRSICIECAKKRSKNYYRKNREKIREYARIFHHNNKEKQNENSRRYYQNNREKLYEAQKKWVEKNREKVNAKRREYDQRLEIKQYNRVRNIKYRHTEKHKVAQARSNEVMKNELRDSYIRRNLKRDGFPKDMIDNKEFIEVKRLMIKTKRLCRISKN